jgi:hypothetical protein
MSTGRVLTPNRRRPRPGCFFTGLRVAGWLLIAGGGLLLAIGLIGSLVMLVRAGPSLGDTLQHLDEQMGGFIFILLLVNLLVFPVVGVMGAALVGLGLVVGYLTTEREPATPVQGNLAAGSTQLR